MNHNINIERKINLLASDISSYIISNNLNQPNPHKCAWEAAKKLKDKVIMIDELDDFIVAYKEDAATHVVTNENKVALGNLSQTMRDLYIDKGMSINDIRKQMGCSYIRVKNVIKKLPEYKARKAAEEEKED